MKQKFSLNRSLIIILSVGLVAVCGFNVTAQAKSQDLAEQPARLIIHRIPNIGSNVIVDLYLDGTPFGSIGYGQSFDRSLPVGRHILSVVATPRPTFSTRSNTAMNVESGKTYVFTAEDNDSGSLVLK